MRDPLKAREARARYEVRHPERRDRLTRLRAGVSGSSAAPAPAAATEVRTVDSYSSQTITAGDSAGPVSHPKVKRWRPGPMMFGREEEVDATEEDE